jgi:hypothetical protein
MTNAKRDDNFVPSILATSNIDGVTPIPLQVTSNRLKINNGTTGFGLPFGNAERDENRIPTIWGVSSADGITPIPIYCDLNGVLLVKSV